MKLPSQFEAMKSIRKPMPRPTEIIEQRKGKGKYKRDKSWKKNICNDY